MTKVRIDSNKSKRNRQAMGRRRPRLECLERRTLLTILVDTFDDVVGDDGVTSLREAIDLAASNAGADTIELPAGTYPLDLGVLAIDDPSGPLTIRPEAGGTATIDGQLLSGVFFVAAGSEVTLEGLEVINGSAFAGGGLLNEGSVAVLDSTFRDNAGEFGGGIFNTGTLAVSGSTFEGNSARETAAGSRTAAGDRLAARSRGTRPHRGRHRTFGGNRRPAASQVFDSAADGLVAITDAGPTARSPAARSRQRESRPSHRHGHAVSGTRRGNTAAERRRDRQLGELSVCGSTFEGNSAIIGGGIHTFGGFTGFGRP